MGYGLFGSLIHTYHKGLVRPSSSSSSPLDFSMPGPLGFPGRGYAQPYAPYGHHPHAHRGGHYPEDPSRMYAQYTQQRGHPFLRMFGGQQSPHGMAGSQSPFGGWPSPSPLMGTPMRPGFPSPCGSGGNGLSMGFGCQRQPGFLGRPPMSGQTSSPFGFASLPQAHPAYRHRHRGYSSRRESQRGAFMSRFLDEDDSDDDSDYYSAFYRSPMRRGRGMRHSQYSNYGRQHRPGWFDDSDDYDGYYDDFDEDDDDFDDYLPGRRWQRY